MFFGMKSPIMKGLIFYNMPIYFAEYTFDQDKLCKIHFGFEYP